MLGARGGPPAIQFKMRTRATSRLRIERPPHPLRDARSEKLFRQAVAHEMLLARESARFSSCSLHSSAYTLVRERAAKLAAALGWASSAAWRSGGTCIVDGESYAAAHRPSRCAESI
jgi:hypothetical protein